VTQPARPEGVATDERYRTEEFCFLADEGEDVESWRSFVRAKAERRAHRRQQRTMRIRASLAGLLVVLIAALLAWHPWSRGSAIDPADEALDARQLTVLFQLREPDGPAVAGALASHDREAGKGSLLVVPADLSVSVAGEGRQPVSDALTTSGPTLTRESVSDLLGVRIDASWVLDQPTFVRIADRVGGVEVDVERAILTAGREIVHPGRQQLTGVQAYDYATYLAPGESEGARSDRVGAVLRALLAAVPVSYEQTREALDDLGVLGDAGLPVERLAALLTSLSRGLAGERVQVAALPLGAAGELDANVAEPLLRGFVPAGAAGGQGEVTPRVVVRFAGADVARQADVRALLVNAGYRFVDGGVHDKAQRTVVLVRESGARRLGEAVALTLGLDRGAVGESAGLPASVDVLVVLAAGYQPL
jgi:hypothetical protein